MSRRLVHGAITKRQTYRPNSHPDVALLTHHGPAPIASYGRGACFRSSRWNFLRYSTFVEYDVWGY
jgi:hypothetical protein